MKLFKFKSLTMRIWATFTIVILVIVFSISLLYLFAFKKFDENAKLQDLKVSHDIILNSENYDRPMNRFDELKNLKGSESFICNIVDKEIKIINIRNKKEEPPPPDPHGVDPNDIKRWMASFITEDSMYKNVVFKYYNNVKFTFIISSINYGETGKSYLISYAPSIQDNSLLYSVIAIAMIFIAIGFVTAKLVADYISKPLKDLEDFTVRIAQKYWKEPIVIKNSDEIGRLAVSMNKMQEQLKRAQEEEKMFLQSISHDLKTPVMIIMSHAEAIIDGVYIESVEKTAEIIKEESISLEKKIKQMLYLNTLDYALENNSKNTEIKFSELIFHIINRFEIINNKIKWENAIEEVNISGNADKIQVAIENILDNALRYAKENICVTLKREGSFAVLEIYNDGTRISDKHINHIFDNLYKDKTGNFGLGLAISKKIIDFYSGEIKAVNKEKGVSFIIKLLLE